MGRAAGLYFKFKQENLNSFEILSYVLDVFTHDTTRILFIAHLSSPYRIIDGFYSY